jgi:hypothetical protein
MGTEQRIQLTGHTIYNLLVDILRIKHEVRHFSCWLLRVYILQAELEIPCHLLLSSELRGISAVIILPLYSRLQPLYFFIILLKQLVILRLTLDHLLDFRLPLVIVFYLKI